MTFRLFGASLFGALALFIAAPLAHAQSSLSVSITPPIFQLSIGPGQTWSSAVKVINNNTVAVTYYAQAVDFEASGETGNASFVPVIDELNDPTLDTFSLASWITFTSTSVLVGAGQSAEIPFTITVPKDAEPGGHYAAILVGTQPGAAQSQGALVKVSSYVSSLILLQIQGDIVESGRIREFSTSNILYQSPEADFVLRFENTGNTHIKPEGDITIYNMWGKERGQVLINQDSGNFGNVLPKSIREFDFSWDGDSDPFDIGLYRAVVTLTYGDQEKQNVSAETYFWVVPVIPVTVGLSGLILFIVLITWFIRRYVRRALSLEKERLGIVGPAPAKESAVQEVEYTVQALFEPFKEGAIDLRNLAGKRSTAAPEPRPEGAANRGSIRKGDQLTILTFIRKYKLFLLFIIVLIAGGLFVWHYFGTVLVPERGFQIKDVQIQEETTSTGDATTSTP